MRRCLSDERGSVFPMVAGFVFVLLLALGLALEVGWAMNERERLKGATEAAALAGALHAEPFLRLEVPQSRRVCTPGPTPEDPPTCEWEYRTVPVIGKEAEVVPSWASLAACGAGGWKCPLSPVVICRGVTYPKDTEQVMSYTFGRNVGTAPGQVSSLTSSNTDDKSATTTVRARGSFSTTIGRLLGQKQMEYRARSTGFSELRPLPWPDPKATCP